MMRQDESPHQVKWMKADQVGIMMFHSVKEFVHVVNIFDGSVLNGLLLFLIISVYFLASNARSILFGVNRI